MRIQGRIRMGYFPLPLKDAQRIRGCFSLSRFGVLRHRSVHRQWGSVSHDHGGLASASVRHQTGRLSCRAGFRGN